MIWLGIAIGFTLGVGISAAAYFVWVALMRASI